MPRMTSAPEKITLAWLEVVVMPNGEVICDGRTLGWFNKLGRFLSVKVFGAGPDGDPGERAQPENGGQ